MIEYSNTEYNLIRNSTAVKAFNAELNKLTDKRNKIISQILKKKLSDLGIVVDYETESKRLFSKFKVTYENQKECYWYDDESITGLLLGEFEDI